MPSTKQHIFAMTHQKLDLKSQRTADQMALEQMQLVPPTLSPGPWELVSWQYDRAIAGGIHVVWRHE